MAEHRNLRVEIDSSIATVTLDRPEVLNALDARTIDELEAAVDEILVADEVRGAIVTGAGERAFVAGADINDLARMTPMSGVALSRRGQEVFTKIERSPKVFVAAVNGFALGGGCELALACHLRVASTNARFGCPEVKLGIIPGYGATVRLPRLVGKGRALEIILTGEMVSAEEAYRIGLVNRVLPPESLLEGARKLLSTITANGPVAVGLAIESVTRGLEAGLEEGLALESTLFGLLGATEDFREGVAAFAAKRPPNFSGR